MKIARELYLAFENLLVDGHRVIIVEGINARKHLIGEDTKCPPVNRLAMAFVEEDFGGEVLRSAAQRISARLAVLGKSKVCQLEVTLLIDEDVLRLQVPVDNVQ